MSLLPYQSGRSAIKEHDNPQTPYRETGQSVHRIQWYHKTNVTINFMLFSVTSQPDAQLHNSSPSGLPVTRFPFQPKRRKYQSKAKR
jgi:hypothetical protein